MTWLLALLCRFGWHRDATEVRGAWCYHECEVCGRRCAHRRSPDLTGPLAHGWLAGGTFDDGRRVHPRGGSGTAPPRPVR